jgi:hypothetical protein
MVRKTPAWSRFSGYGRGVAEGVGFLAFFLSHWSAFSLFFANY